MSCPHCNSDNIIGNGTTTAGSPRYRCKACGKSFTTNPTKRGKKPLGDRPMTQVERNRKYKKRLQDGGSL